LFISYQRSFFNFLTDIWKRTIEEEEGGEKRETGERRRLEVKRRELDPANLDREGAGVSRHFSSYNDDIYKMLFLLVAIYKYTLACTESASPSFTSTDSLSPQTHSPSFSCPSAEYLHSIILIVLITKSWDSLASIFLYA
jgi:hypothetical protein